MRDVSAQGIEFLIGSGNLDAALPTGGAEVVVGAGVVDGGAVDGEVVVVETFVHRAFGGASPDTVLVLVEHGATTAAQTQADDD